MEILQKIKLLKKIKPEKEWVFLTKRRILGKSNLSPLFEFQSLIFNLFFRKSGILVFSLFVFSLFFSAIVLNSQDSSVSKRENQVIFQESKTETLKKEEIKSDKEIAKSEVRLEGNTSKPASNVVKSKKSKNISQKENNSTKTENFETNNFASKEQQEDIENQTQLVAKYLIEYFETRSLTEEKKEDLKAAKEYFEKGDFGKVIELLLK